MSLDSNEILLRPRFSMDFDENADTLLASFKENLAEGDCEYCSKIVDKHVFIDVPKKDNHFWSPQLHIEIEELDDNTSKIKGLFGPKPQVWTLFMFIHFLVGTAFLFFLVAAYSKWSLKESVFFPATMLVVLPLLWILLYFLGRMGKATGKKQMDELKRFMQKSLDRLKD